MGKQDDEGILRQADDPYPDEPPLFVIDLMDENQTGKGHWLSGRKPTERKTAKKK